MEHWEKELLDGVSSDKGWALVERFSRQMRCMPDEVRAGAGILVKALESCGIKPVVHTPKIYLGIPVNASIDAHGTQIPCKASALSPAVDGLRAQLVHLRAKPSQQGVHPGDPAALFERQFESAEAARAFVSGHIVLTEGLSNPARTQLLQTWGALAVIAINPGDRAHWGTNSVIWGSPIGDEFAQLPNIASVAVSRTHGDNLLAIASAEGSITLTVNALHGWFEQPVITAEISGSGPEAKDFILLHSHYDSWEYGVGDNATGNAILLEVARLFATNPAPFRRSVRFAWWPGHSAGRYAGSSWYADAFGTDLAENCVAHVNCDSPGCKDATSYASIRSMTEAAPLLQRSVKDLFGQECSITRPGRAGDYSFNNIGVTGTMLTSSMVPKAERERRGWYPVGGCGGSPAWHSEFDTMEVADRSILEKDTKLYALITARLANDEIVPLDYEAAFDDIRHHLQLEATGKLTDDQISHIDQALSDAARRLKEARRHAAEGPAAFNAMTKRLSRALVRLNYAVGPPHVQDPAKSQRPLPLLDEVAPNSRDDKPDVELQRMRIWNAINEHLAEIQRVLSKETGL